MAVTDRHNGRWKDNDLFGRCWVSDETSKSDCYMGQEVMRKIKAKDRTWRVISIQIELKYRCEWDHLGIKWGVGRVQGIGWKLKCWGLVLKRTLLIQACYRTCQRSHQGQYW